MPESVKLDLSKPQEVIDVLRAMSREEVMEMRAEKVGEGILLRPVFVEREQCREKFTALAETWLMERGPHSLVRDLVDHPAYREIIAMGGAAIPHILERLDTHLEDWFPALTAITGVDPLPPQSAGKMEEMAHAWKQWGRENGYYPAVF